MGGRDTRRISHPAGEQRAYTIVKDLRGPCVESKETLTNSPVDWQSIHDDEDAAYVTRSYMNVNPRKPIDKRRSYMFVNDIRGNDGERRSTSNSETTGGRDTRHVQCSDPAREGRAHMLVEGIHEITEVKRDGEGCRLNDEPERRRTNMFVDDSREFPEGRTRENYTCCPPDGRQPDAFVDTEEGELCSVKPMHGISSERRDK